MHGAGRPWRCSDPARHCFMGQNLPISVMSFSLLCCGCFVAPWLLPRGAIAFPGSVTALPRESLKIPGKCFPSLSKECSPPTVMPEYSPAHFTLLPSLFGSILPSQPPLQWGSPASPPPWGTNTAFRVWGWDSLQQPRCRLAGCKETAPGGTLLFSRRKLVLGAACTACPSPLPKAWGGTSLPSSPQHPVPICRVSELLLPLLSGGGH